MKKSYVALMMGLLVFTSNALSSQKYNFTFTFEGEQHEVSMADSDYYSALSKAAKDCFKHFKQKPSFHKTKGIDLIDVCANPRS